MSRFISALVIALTTILLLPVQFGGSTSIHASNGARTIQTVALHRQGCTATNTGPVVGSARFSLDDQGGIAGGVEIDIALSTGLVRSSYDVFVLSDPCQVLFSGGTLTTDDRGRGDLSVHVPSSAVPQGAQLRVQVIASAQADIITSDLTTGL